MKTAIRIGIVSASLIVASGIAIGSIELPGVDEFALAYARMAALTLGLVGVPVSLNGVVIDVGEFVAVVAAQCTAIELILVYSAAVLVTPAHYRARMWALALGIPALCVLNFVRVVSLLLVGFGSPEHFDTAHLVVWQIAMTLVGFLMWFMWYGRVTGEGQGGGRHSD